MKEKSPCCRQGFFGGGGILGEGVGDGFVERLGVSSLRFEDGY